MRLFIALEIPAEIRESLREKTRKIMGKGQGVRWVDPELWHITLHFLGEIEENRLADVTATMAQLTGGVSGFQWRCRGLGAFPDLRKPRVLWAGVDQGSREMVELAEKIVKALERVGLPAPAKPFHPHLTLGRAAGSARGGRGKKPAPVASRVADFFYKEPTTDFGTGSVGRVVLMKSDLATTGPTYTVLESWDLDRSFAD